MKYKSLTEGKVKKGGLNKPPTTPRPKIRPAPQKPRKEVDILYKYDQRIRTLEDVADLFNVAFDIKRLRGQSHLWQVKLERLRLYGSGITGVGYIICRASNPNAAMDLLCQKISYKTVVGPKVNGKSKILVLGLVQRNPLYLRYSGSENE